MLEYNMCNITEYKLNIILEYKLNNILEIFTIYFNRILTNNSSIGNDECSDALIQV